MLLDALNRHRGKGSQKITVEHVHACIPAGRPRSVWLRHWGEGVSRNQRINPMGGEFPMHLIPRCGAKTRRGTPCQCPAMPNGRCRIHGGTAPGAPKGNRNAVKHGFYSAEIVAHRRKVAALLRAARKLAHRPGG
jgi:hypothetical protein